MPGVRSSVRGRAVLRPQYVNGLRPDDDGAGVGDQGLVTLRRTASRGGVGPAAARPVPR